MLILEVSTIDPGELRRYAEIYGGEAEIFLRDDGKGALVLYDGPVAAGNPEAKSVKKLFDGGRFGKSGGDWLFCVALWTPDDYRNEFLAWYRTEHLPILLECPVWDGCRFLEGKVSSGCQFFALHQLSDKKALDSQERKRSRSTPWFKRLAKNGWFDGAFQRTLYRRFAQI
jgi:hypothetical protein